VNSLLTQWRYWTRIVVRAWKSTEFVTPKKIWGSLVPSVLVPIIQAANGIRGWALTPPYIESALVCYGGMAFLDFLFQFSRMPATIDAERGIIPVAVYKPDSRTEYINNAREISRRIREIVNEVESSIDYAGPEHIAMIFGNHLRRALAHYSEFRAKAIWTRDQLRAELVVEPLSAMKIRDSHYDNPFNTHGLNDVANHLELLALAVEEKMQLEHGQPYPKPGAHQVEDRSKYSR
jgi:hypothetical protein